MTRMRRHANAVKNSDRDEILGRLGPLAKLRPKTLDNLRNAIRNLAKYGRDPKSLYGFTPLPESYKRHDALLHLHLSFVDIGGGNTADLCAIFKHCSRPYPVVRQGFVAPGSTSPITGRFRANNLEQPMFVGIVEFVKEIQGATLAQVPTSVWLQPLDLCLMFAAKRLDQLEPATREMRRLAAAFPTTPGDSLFKEDRELSPCQCFFTRVIERAQLIDQPIEGGTKLISRFADADAQIGWRKNVYESAERVLASLFVQFGYDNSIVSVGHEGGIRCTERFDVTFCTPDLEAWAIERMHEIYSDHERRQGRRQREEAEDSQAQGVPSHLKKAVKAKPSTPRHFPLEHPFYHRRQAR